MPERSLCYFRHRRQELNDNTMPSGVTLEQCHLFLLRLYANKYTLPCMRQLFSATSPDLACLALQISFTYPSIFAWYPCRHKCQALLSQSLVFVPPI